ncbi:hypothetical protein JCM11641_003687 [Rhodosporidiobolus odoratus]
MCPVEMPEGTLEELAGGRGHGMLQLLVACRLPPEFDPANSDVLRFPHDDWDRLWSVGKYKPTVPLSRAKRAFVDSGIATRTLFILDFFRMWNKQVDYPDGRIRLIAPTRPVALTAQNAPRMFATADPASLEGRILSNKATAGNKRCQKCRQVEDPAFLTPGILKACGPCKKAGRVIMYCSSTLPAALDAIRAVHRSLATPQTTPNSLNDDQLGVVIKEAAGGIGATVSCKLGRRKPGRKKAGDRRINDRELCPFNLKSQQQETTTSAFTVTSFTPHSLLAHSRASDTIFLPPNQRAAISGEVATAPAVAPDRPFATAAYGAAPTISTIASPPSVSPTRGNPLGLEVDRVWVQLFADNPLATSITAEPAKFVISLLPAASTRSGRRQKRPRATSQGFPDVDPSWTAWRALLGEAGAGAAMQKKWEKEVGEADRMGGKGALRAWGWWKEETSQESDEEAGQQPPNLELLEAVQEHAASAIQHAFPNSSSPEAQGSDGDEDFTPASLIRPRRSSVRTRNGGARSGTNRRSRIPTSPAMSTRRTLRANPEDTLDLAGIPGVLVEEQTSGTDPSLTFSIPRLSPASLSSAFFACPQTADFPEWSSAQYSSAEGYLPVSPFPHHSDCALHSPTSFLSQQPGRSLDTARMIPYALDNASPPVSPASTISSAGLFTFSPAHSFASAGSPETSFTSTFAESPAEYDAFSNEPPPCQPDSPTLPHVPRGQSPWPCAQPKAPPAELTIPASNVSHFTALAEVMEEQLEEGEIREELSEKDTVNPEKEADVLAALLELSSSPRATHMSVGAEDNSAHLLSGQAERGSEFCEDEDPFIQPFLLSLPTPSAPDSRIGSDNRKVHAEAQSTSATSTAIFPFRPLYKPNILATKISQLQANSASSAPPILSLAAASPFLGFLSTYPRPARSRLPALDSFPTLHTPPSVLADFTDPRVGVVLEYLYGRKVSTGECAFLEKRERALWMLMRVMAAVAEVNERSMAEISSGRGRQSRDWMSRG